MSALGQVSVACGPASVLLTTYTTSASTPTLSGETVTTATTFDENSMESESDQESSISSNDNSSAIESHSSFDDETLEGELHLLMSRFKADN
jgi:hypothetical protein